MGHPAILTVDDDPSVSRAIARDLRRRYGEQYRIVRASSAAEALEALKELKLRGGWRRAPPPPAQLHRRPLEAQKKKLNPHGYT